MSTEKRDPAIQYRTTHLDTMARFFLDAYADAERLDLEGVFLDGKGNVVLKVLLWPEGEKSMHARMNED